MKKTAIFLPAILLASSIILQGCTAGAGKAGTSSAASGTVSASSGIQASVSASASDTSSVSDSMTSLLSELSGVSIPTTSQTTEAAASGSAPAAGTSSGANTVKIDSTDGTYEILVPSAWSDLKGQLDSTGETEQNYTIEAGSLDEQSFLISNRESKKNSSLVSLTDYSDTLVSAISKSSDFSNIRNGGTSDFTLKTSGFTAKKTLLTVSYQNQDLAYYIYAVESGNYYYQFCCWTAATNEGAAGDNFDAAVNSLIELG